MASSDATFVFALSKLNSQARPYGVYYKDWRTVKIQIFKFSMESLILAQNERWRRGLGMQVERSSTNLLQQHRCKLVLDSGKRVSNAWAICLGEGDNTPKGVLIPRKTTAWYQAVVKDGDPQGPITSRGARALSASW